MSETIEKKDSSKNTVSTTSAVTAANSGLLLFILYRGYKIQERLDVTEKKEGVILRNLNTLNMEFKRWISVFVKKHMETDDRINELQNIILEQDERITRLEKIVLGVNQHMPNETYNPLH